MSIVDTLIKFTDYESGGTITLHPERCLNNRFRAVGCTRCADACPAEDAITVSDGQPALDNEACLRCGLCLHHCPTEAFTRPDGLLHKLVKTVAALPTSPVDLVCLQHATPDCGPGPQAIQTKRCLAALPAATLLELSRPGREIWLDDTHCSDCPLGKVHPVIAQTVAEVNGWAGLLENSTPISLRTEQAESSPPRPRPVYEADRPPLPRRGLFGSFKQLGAEMAAAEEQVEMVKAGKTVPVSERLPHFVPSQRTKILSILEQSPTSPSPPKASNLPISNLHINAGHCTACGLCARFCPTGALKFLSDGQTFALTLEPFICLGQSCNICVPACPEQAVTSQPAAASPDLLKKKPLAAGELTSCQRCGEPIAKGEGSTTFCFACRAQTNKTNFFA